MKLSVSVKSEEDVDVLLEASSVMSDEEGDVILLEASSVMSRRG